MIKEIGKLVLFIGLNRAGFGCNFQRVDGLLSKVKFVQIARVVAQLSLSRVMENGRIIVKLVKEQVELNNL